MSSPLDPPTDLLAIYRLTRLVTADTILHQPREATVRWAYRAHTRIPPDGMTWAELAEADGPDAPRLASLVTCRWCASVWLAAAVLAARRHAPRLWGPLAHVLAGSAVGTLLAGLEAD